MMAVARLFSKDIAIDLGNNNVCVFERGKGITLQEPAIVAIENFGSRGKPLAIGKKALEMLGKMPGRAEIIRPMVDGVISNAHVVEIILRHCIGSVYGRTYFTRPRLMICTPLGVTPVEERAVRDCALRAGARQVFTMSEPLAAATGADLPVSEPVPSMIVDIGGGTTEAAIISLGGVVRFKSIRSAGNAMDDSIQQFVRKKFNINMSLEEAERAKIVAGSALPDESSQVTFIRGIDLTRGLPVTREISSHEIRAAIHDQLEIIVETVMSVLERCPPELSADMVDRGIVLTGGCSQLRHMDRFIQERTHLPVAVVHSPMTTVARGLGACLENFD